jgi:hypothetical protein
MRTFSRESPGAASGQAEAFNLAAALAVWRPAPDGLALGRPTL